jgi:hypothetical protein
MPPTSSINILEFSEFLTADDHQSFTFSSVEDGIVLVVLLSLFFNFIIRFFHIESNKILLFRATFI